MGIRILPLGLFISLIGYGTICQIDVKHGTLKAVSNRKLRKIDEALLPRIEELLRHGISVRKMAEDWDVPETTIYYWCRTFSLNVIKLKQEGRVQLGGRKKYTYHYYLNQEFKQGRITPRQKKQYLTKFYMHKGGFTLDTADVVQSESNEDNVETVS